MFQKVKNIFKKYQELVMYGIFGVGATAINIVAFYIFANLIHLQFLIANVIAWLAAFIFAFITNKLFVFDSKSWIGTSALKELLSFFFVRLGTGVLDTILMYLFIDYFLWNDMVSKIVVNILVIIINYIASKFWIFSTKKTIRRRLYEKK